VKFQIGLSPCPNDTFIFDALLHGKIDTGGFLFEPVLEDVETLNQWAVQGKLDITKMSVAAACEPGIGYDLLNSGAALGKGVGPLLISKDVFTETEFLKIAVDKLKNAVIAIPGNQTTAHFLLRFFAPLPVNKVFMPFHCIEDWVTGQPQGALRFGVIIHENRFTYLEKGLNLVRDLGAYWETKTGLPIPLGAIFIRKEFPDRVKKTVENLIRKSVQYAFENYTEQLPAFVINNAQEMNTAIMWKHIRLYVNEYTTDIGSEGFKAIERMQELIRKSNGTV
jgi:1,4-dihydroxy-6-naphthoate synthase